MILAELPPYSLVQFAAYRSSSYSSRSYSSYSSRSYSSPTRSYSSTRTTTTKPSTSTGYRSTTTSRPSTGYKSTRNTSPITRSNLSARTSVAQRTTVINNYHSGFYGYNSFFHPFGWGMGGGNFWFFMWLLDNHQYMQNQQIVQASGVVAPPVNLFWQNLVFLLVALIVLGLLGWGVLILITHLRWI